MNATSGEPVNMLLRREPNDPKVNPSVLRWPYGTDTYSSAETDQNALGIVGYQHEYPSRVDLLNFMTKFRTNAEAAIPTIKVIDLRYDSKARKEVNLDVQYTMALAYPAPVVYYRGAGNGVRLLTGGKLACKTDCPCHR